MGFLEAVRMALSAIWANKVRSGLTLLGMVVGVFAVIASVTAVKVIDVYLNESLQLYGAQTFSIERYGSVRLGGGERAYRPAITYDQVRRLKRRVDAGLEVSLMESFDWAEKARTATRETAEPKVMLMGADEHMLLNFGFELDEGRAFTEQDVQNARPVALLGAPIAEELFPNETPLGKEVRVGRVRLEVVGVLESKGTFLGFDPNNRIYAPITTTLRAYGDGGRDIASVSVRVRDARTFGPAQEQIISHMRVIRGVGPGEANNFLLETNDSARSGFDAFTGTLTVAGAVVGLIALVAAGIGIMNIMLVSVTERTREIGVRKAVGAKRIHIMGQFLLEAVVLCQIGGLLGIAFGAGVGNVVALLFGISAAFPWGWAVGAVAGVTFIAIVFGSYPAFKAARLDPIDSLRYE
jgi:putative ABC transport system permease protein